MIIFVIAMAALWLIINSSNQARIRNLPPSERPPGYTDEDIRRIDQEFEKLKPSATNKQTDMVIAVIITIVFFVCYYAVTGSL